jgi:hypothetical protein
MFAHEVHEMHEFVDGYFWATEDMSSVWTEIRKVQLGD